MFRALYGLCGELTVELTAFASTLTVDDETLAKLRVGLKGSDYTYLIVKTATVYEVIRTISFVGNAVAIQRAQDNTVALDFPAGTEVEFVMGDQAIADMINNRMLGQINITGSGIVTVTQTGQNQFNINAPAVNITSTSDKVLVGGEFPAYILSAPLVSGCCD